MPVEKQIKNAFSCIDTNNNIAVTREDGDGWDVVKGVKYMVTEGDVTLGGEHAMQHTDDVL